jgi:hypothetical protein
MDSKNLLKIVGGVVVLLLIFQAGVFVGYHKARFSGRLGDNYIRAFGSKNNLPGGHGAVGQVVKTATSSIIVADRDNIEKIIVITSGTDVRLGRNIASTTDLKIGDYVTVLGTPDQAGQIQARLIRILPPAR